jgi:hypothetical protein
MQRSTSPREQAASSQDTGSGEGSLEDRVELPIVGTRKRERPDSGRFIHEKETIGKPSSSGDHSESTKRDGKTSHLSLGETKTSDVETQRLASKSHRSQMATISRSNNHSKFSSSNASSRSQKGRQKKGSGTVDGSFRISREGDSHDLPQNIGVGQRDDTENASSEPEDKASLLYTDNIMAAAAATNELASCSLNFSSYEDGAAIGLQQNTSMGRDDLSSVSAAGLLDVATSQVLINQLILQNAELRHRNMTLHQELEKVKQQVASVLTQLMKVQQQPNLVVQPSPTPDPEVDFLRRIYPGPVAGGDESRTMNPAVVESPTHLGKTVEGTPHGADAAPSAASELTQFQQPSLMDLTANSLLNQFLNQGKSHLIFRRENHEFYYQRRRADLCVSHPLCFKE